MKLAVIFMISDLKSEESTMRFEIVLNLSSFEDTLQFNRVSLHCEGQLICNVLTNNTGMSRNCPLVCPLPAYADFFQRLYSISL